VAPADNGRPTEEDEAITSANNRDATEDTPLLGNDLPTEVVPSAAYRITDAS
jgi:hypothetical protein